MRDPDLVHQAERAAAALEEAWIRWRTRHGLATGALPPVSSYVGYSVEEPWGQPRVVFGIEAAEAERLAAILDDYTGLAPVGLTRAPERRTAERPARDIAPPAWTVPSPTPGGSAQSFEPAQSSGPGRLAVRAGRPGNPAAPPRSPAEWPDGQEARPGSSHDQPGAVVFRSGLPAEQPAAQADRPGQSAQRSAVQPSQADGAARRPGLSAQSRVPAGPPDASAEPSERPEASRAAGLRPDTKPAAKLPALGQPSNGAAPLLPPGQPVAGVTPAPLPGQPSAGVVPPAAVPVRAPAPDQAGPRPLPVTPVAAPPAPREPAPREPASVAAADDVDYGRAEELTAEQPILPRALRRAAALADMPAELPDHEAAYLQELAARPGIVALRPRSARPEPAPAESAPPAASPWPSVTYPSRPAPLLGLPAADDAEPEREAQASPVGLVAPIGRGTPAGSGVPAPGPPRDGAAPQAEPTPADGTPVTRLLPVSRLNRTRKPSEPGSWPAVGGQAHPTDTAV